MNGIKIGGGFIFNQLGIHLPHASEFSCDYNRGYESDCQYIVHHRTTSSITGFGIPFAFGIGDSDAATEVNTESVLLTRARDCSANHDDRQVNFLAVDFYANGDLFKVVNALNGVE